ncbi:hypothetical protein GGD61_001711 [Bradyrhizobium sp. SBR1B]|nr:hypothetical protein [Bradyrhizobium sp. SBR1B]
MAISLKGSVKKKSAAEDQPIITIYGVPKIGKSSLASEFPRPVFIQTAAGESVPAGIVADTIEVRNYNDLCEAIGALVNEEHNYATAIFDSTTGLENIIRAEACARNGWKTIEEPGYGKGYKIAATIFLEYIDGVMTLRSLRQMAVVQLGHCDINRFESTTIPTPRWRSSAGRCATIWQTAMSTRSRASLAGPASTPRRDVRRCRVVLRSLEQAALYRRAEASLSRASLPLVACLNPCWSTSTPRNAGRSMDTSLLLLASGCSVASSSIVEAPRFSARARRRNTITKLTLDRCALTSSSQMVVARSTRFTCRATCSGRRSRLSWSRLSKQNLRVDKWSVCRG